ncbi:bifunctional phosphoribosylaminoimidazolecarboxamide formyltransferase/IMP cyclohydrolase [Humidisolicoccus flavus]|uniref:bifunctional phosphoribosylaminoimidazolecarboxamide formyltransferase/IMP cyclohydrolase n=1 Tax=Humidisolicoccus flavus TaxID=3111414 RepID=UPI003254E436
MSGASHEKSLYRERDLVSVRRALLSVSDKTGLLDLAAALSAAGVEIVSTGSTAQSIRDAGFAVTEVKDVTGFAEALDGRVKTLHPSIHAGILADLRLEDHEAQLADLGIAPFELVVVNLYPFVETVASGAPADQVVEQIDIGGPAMVRAAAKNHANVAIVTSPAAYPGIIAALERGTTFIERRALAADAFAHTAAYDTAVSEWFIGEAAARERRALVETATAEHGAVGGLLTSIGEATLANTLRYGENSHQAGSLYRLPDGRGIAQAELLHGKEMSYNNYVDADAALRTAFDFTEPAVAIIKHQQPCGVAVAARGASDPIASAHLRAHECDPVSAFGGVIAANRTVTAEMASTVAGIFTEVVVAPDFEPEAIEILTKKKSIRLLRIPAEYQRESHEVRQVSGGVLVQESDSFEGFSSHTWRRVAGRHVSDATLADLEFAWKACRSVKSNAILLAKDGASVGVGMGQVNRVDSCTLAVARAGERVTGSVAASDAFFPFADGPQILIDAGVTAIVQPGGSVRDEEVIAAAEAAGITMYFTGERHFFH